MSDEQKMPEVIYASDSSCDMMYGKWWRSKELDHYTPYLRCPDNVDPDDAIVLSGGQLDEMQKNYMDLVFEIDTLTAERDALQAKVDTIVNYINSEETNEATGFWLKMLLGYDQAAQLKEQDDE